MLHHVGLVVPSIRAVASRFAASTATQWDGEVIHDPLQGVRVAFFRSLRSASDPLLELVEPADEQSPVVSFLRRGGGLNHLCYQVASVRAELDNCRSYGATIVRQPLPAAAFNGRLIGWVYTPDRLLIEYLQQ